MIVRERHLQHICLVASLSGKYCHHQRNHIALYQEHATFLSCSTLAVRATVIAKMTRKLMFD